MIGQVLERGRPQGGKIPRKLCVYCAHAERSSDSKPEPAEGINP